jgi:hypothetical protein
MAKYNATTTDNLLEDTFAIVNAKQHNKMLWCCADVHILRPDTLMSVKRIADALYVAGSLSCHVAAPHCTL